MLANPNKRNALCMLTLLLTVACAQNPDKPPASTQSTSTASTAANAPNAANDPFTLLFSQTCMKHYFDAPALVEVMDGGLGQRLSGAPAGAFLTGKPGVAWAVTAAQTDQIVALRNDGVCTVYTSDANVGQIRENWRTLVGTAPDGLRAYPVKSKADTSSNNRQRESYMWMREAQPGQLVFTLTTTTDASRRIKAISSVSWVGQ